jgi:lysyl-tRNA synthetase class 2
MSNKENRSHRLPLFHLQQAIRNFFNKEGFMDVLTPPVVANPGMEVHIHPFQIRSVQQNKNRELYLHTSPEFHMKELLSEGLEKIFTMSYCFRDEPNSETHRPQFIMLEWYRSQQRYEKIMSDCEELFKGCHEYLKGKKIKTATDEISFTKKTVAEIFQETIGVSILDYIDEKEKLFELIKSSFKNIHLPETSKDHSWDDLFFLLMLNEVEPHFKKYDFLLLYEFPAPLKALSTLKESDPRVCERFEIYAKGIELCNCFNELTDLEEQRARFMEQAKEKKELYNYELPTADVLFNALDKGMPASAGIALGVERLLMALTGNKDCFY